MLQSSLLTYLEIVRIAEVISPQSMRVIAVGFLDIDIEQLGSARVANSTYRRYNVETLLLWRKRNPENSRQASHFTKLHNVDI